jgi:hypothetical protein
MKVTLWIRILFHKEKEIMMTFLSNGEEEIFIIGSPYRLRGSECRLRNEAFS